MDTKTTLFQPCLKWLMHNSGQPERKARAIIGKWCKCYGDECVLEAMTTAAREQPVEPVAWITACLQATDKAEAELRVSDMFMEAAKAADMR